MSSDSANRRRRPCAVGSGLLARYGPLDADATLALELAEAATAAPVALSKPTSMSVMRSPKMAPKKMPVGERCQERQGERAAVQGEQRR